MATRYPLVLNGTQIQEIQSGDTLAGLGLATIATSGSASDLTTGTIPQARMYSGAVIKVTSLFDDVRQVTSSSNDYVVKTWSNGIVKVGSGPLIVQFYSGDWNSDTNGGEYGFIAIGNSKYYGGIQNNYGAPEGSVTIGQYYLTGIAAGTYNFAWGWQPIDGNSNRWFGVVNTNSSEDSRNRQNFTQVIITELAS
jgi:hypothetical protein